MKIAIGSDHVGFPLKEAVISYLQSIGAEVWDQGTSNAQDVVDYPDYARKVAMAVSSGACERGVVICGTGVGISMAANKYPGVRAVLCDDLYIARQSRIHNDANVIAMGALVTNPHMACQYLEVWLNTAFAGGRHSSRIAKLDWAFADKGYDLSGCNRSKIKTGVALSPHQSVFGPLLFAGDLTGGLRAASKAGFDAVELSLRTAHDLDAKSLQKELRTLDLSVSAIATGQSFLHDGLCLASTLEEKRREAVQRITGHIHFAAEMGAQVIIGGIRGRLMGEAEEQLAQKEAGMAALSVCAEEAQACGVTLLLEPINRFETNWINTLEEGLQCISQLGKANVLLLPDTFHMNIEERDLSLALSAAGSQIGYVHFADSNRLAPGQGHIDFPRVLQTLCEIGYAGTITAEILPLPSDREAMHLTSTFLQSLLNA